jgi:methylthioribose-1-phosphate isomerase
VSAAPTAPEAQQLADPTAAPETPDVAEPREGKNTPAGEVSATPEGGADLGRRRFFRQFAGDLANTAATMMGAAQAIQRTSAELASAILDPAQAALDEVAEGVVPGDGDESAATAFRTSFRVDGATIVFVDQRALPRAVVEHSAVSAAEVTYAIRNGVVVGGPALGQAAAVGLALTGERVRETRPYARRATLRGAANALINVSPTHASIRWAVERVMAAYRAVGELDEDGGAIASAMREEADQILAEATDDHGRLVDAGLAAVNALPRPADEPLRILVHGVSGTLAGGQFGTALAVAIAAHHAERQVRVIVPEGRHGYTGSRISCWELAAAGVPYVLVADAAAPSLIAAGEVDVVLVPADRVAANGDVAAIIGTYPIAAAAAAASNRVPVLVCAPLSAIDAATPDGSSITIGARPEGELDRFGDVLLAPRGTEVRSPGHDVTPAHLVTYFVTGDGLRQPPFGGEVA